MAHLGVNANANVFGGTIFNGGSIYNLHIRTVDIGIDYCENSVLTFVRLFVFWICNFPRFVCAPWTVYWPTLTWNHWSECSPEP